MTGVLYENFSSNIQINHTYLACLTISHINLSGEVTVNRSIDTYYRNEYDFITSSTSISTTEADTVNNTELLIISMASLVVAILVGGCVIVVIIIISISCICKKGRRPILAGEALASCSNQFTMYYSFI